MNEDRSKTIRDPIYGYIFLPHYGMEIVDTPQFQRLRDIKQLGTSYFVFPGASHNRFEHSLGVSHLANMWITTLKKNSPDLDITERERRLVSVAGLTHDLGHGPFSHVFEEWLFSRGVKWRHEEMSIQMLEYLIDDNALEYSREDIRFVFQLILGQREGEKGFLSEIVANSRTSIDVDKFDYLSRDCYHLGLKCVSDFTRLINKSRVIDNEICFDYKEAYNIYELFHTRYTNHKIVYTHRVSKAIECMIDDVLTEADSVFRIRERISSPEEFSFLSDSLLWRIETTPDDRLKKAQDILRRIFRRQLYKCVVEMVLDKSHSLTAEQLVTYSDQLKPEDVIVITVELNYGMGDRNPVDQVSFYSGDGDSKFSLERESVSLLAPTRFSERILRIYARDSEKSKEIWKAFQLYLRYH